MDKFSYLSNANPAFFEQLYDQYKNAPDTLEESWHRFFEGYELASANFENGGVPENFQKEFKVINLINAYRTRGHLFTKTNPVRERRTYSPTLAIENFGLDQQDMLTYFQAGEEVGLGPASLKDILKHLEKVYCKSIGVEYMYLAEPEEIEWIKSKIHINDNQPKYSDQEKITIYDKLNKAIGFEHFMHTKFVGQKRFSLEGAEALIPTLDTVIETAADMEVKEFVLGMAHRGRLNVLSNIFGKSYEDIFTEFEGKDYDDPFYMGDVKYHYGFSQTRKTDSGKEIHLSIAPNPSHLEAVDPVVQGLSRAKIDKRYKNDPQKLLPILIHGDAALSGQGVVYEIAQMAQLKGYKTGGTVHIVINNQVGFTTNYIDGRSSTYCTDIAKVTKCPVFHVNGDDVEAVIHASKIAMEYRLKFQKDVYIDLLCYRKYGHNEGDEPRFTQPVLYKSIAKHPNLRDIYAQELIDAGILDQTSVAKKQTDFKAELEKHLARSKKQKTAKISSHLQGDWKKLRESTDKDFETEPKTGVASKKLKEIAKIINAVPSDKNFFRKLKKILDGRNEMIKKDALDWGMCEMLAYGSLLSEGHSIRFSGQDVERGTFSHRHAVLKIEDSAEEYTPLKEVNPKADFQIYNSLLSEYGVLGFEYGYSLASPNGLTIWEAQFGDFSNGGQIVYDQFITCGEDKWKRMSGLVVLLPHGYEGQGAEHSSARIERYLELCAENNIQAINCTTPANFFHALRRQLKREIRKPLIVFTPKKLLRYPSCISSLKDLEKDSFQPLMDDVKAKVSKVETLAFCSGKVFYELDEKRQELGADHVAIIRLEQLYPIPHKKIKEVLKKYSKVKTYYWVQEEPQNMGAYPFMLRNLPQINFTYLGRKASATTATGSPARHRVVHAKIINGLFEKKKVMA